MPLSRERILYLLDAYSSNKALESEEQELFEWLNESGHHEVLEEYIKELTEQPGLAESVGPVDWERIYLDVASKAVMAEKPAVLRSISRFRWSAVAAIVILIIAAAYLYEKDRLPPQKILVNNRTQPPPKNIRAPLSNKAVLTLADGSKIQLDSLSTGRLATQGTVQVLKTADGRLCYQGNGGDVLYNTLDVPRGSKLVTIELSDGTKVWLNSESSLRYPASFKGTERKVEITGEAYFEVAHNASMPFIVKKNAIEIRVIGTHFNVNTYGDAGVSRITLLQGSVEVTMNDHQHLLMPGQQVIAGNDLSLSKSVNVEQVMAWKNGLFHFGDKADLHLIMKMIARWYDVEVAYEKGPISQRFGGEMPMNSSLLEVLEILRTSGVRFTIEGRKVIVHPRSH